MKPLILCVEDDLDIQFLLKLSLENLGGFEVIFASNGYEALKLLDCAKPNLLIIDWMLPEMNGAQLLKKIREKEDHNYIKSILLTAKANINLILGNDCLLFDDVIIKPFDPLSLADQIKKFL
ncbi:MAG: response regulator [Oceanospirillales bacterium]|nr:MAG: response regulator [Oceanospirillales bacterium]